MISPQREQASSLLRSVRESQATVVFATPSLTNNMSAEFRRSMFETLALLKRGGHRPAIIERNGDQFIANARNKLVSDFLLKHPNAHHLFFLDDDVGWPPHKVIEFLDRNECIVAGVYPKKSHILDFPVDLCINTETGDLIERDGLIKALVVPFGFVCIRRSVLEIMSKNSRIYTEQESDGKIGTFYNIFESGVFDGGISLVNGALLPTVNGDLNFWGEDYVFCRKWAELGGDIWVDPDIELTHRGPMCWKATLSEHMGFFRSQAKRLIRQVAE
jgi:hypothetical protein